ncbi:MAG: signal peptidase I, partial [Kocuria sp.]|nr:signal peptidase I [Kocuria sp.]
MMAQKRSHRSRTSGKRSPASWLGGALLNILAALGVVCIVLVILSFVFNVSIMMFRTGSMSPTITAGSIAFVHEIPAEKMEVGDIITADRGEKVLPVTHRVTSILDGDAQSGEVTFEMKGDANEAKDPEP